MNKFLAVLIYVLGWTGIRSISNTVTDFFLGADYIVTGLGSLVVAVTVSVLVLLPLHAILWVGTAWLWKLEESGSDA